MQTKTQEKKDKEELVLCDKRYTSWRVSIQICHFGSLKAANRALKFLKSPDLFFRFDIDGRFCSTMRTEQRGRSYQTLILVRLRSTPLKAISHSYKNYLSQFDTISLMYFKSRKSIMWQSAKWIQGKKDANAPALWAWKLEEINFFFFFFFFSPSKCTLWKAFFDMNVQLYLNTLSCVNTPMGASHRMLEQKVRSKSRFGSGIYGCFYPTNPSQRVETTLTSLVVRRWPKCLSVMLRCTQGRGVLCGTHPKATAQSITYCMSRTA